MFDPAVIGTLIIGLRSADAELRFDDPPRHPASARPRRHRPRARRAIADVLRGTASRLDRQLEPSA